jgi:hypothetical protein
MGSTIITAGILIGGTFLFIMLVMASHKRSKKNENQKKQSILNEMVSANGLVISAKEFLGQHLIAIDETNKAVMFVDAGNNGDTAVLIRMDKIKSSSVDVVAEQLFEERKGKKVSSGSRTALIQILLESKTPQTNHTPLVFYRAIINNIGERDYLKGRAEYWNQKISALIGN